MICSRTATAPTYPVQVFDGELTQQWAADNGVWVMDDGIPSGPEKVYGIVGNKDGTYLVLGCGTYHALACYMHRDKILNKCQRDLGFDEEYAAELAGRIKAKGDWLAAWRVTNGK